MKKINNDGYSYYLDNNGEITQQKNIVDKQPLSIIEDIEDVIEIVAGNCDGKRHIFPPPTEFLNDIFQNDDFDDRIISRYKFPYGVWFRGQPRICYRLIPSLFRNSMDINRICHKEDCKIDKIYSSYYEETNMFNHFVLRMPEYQRVQSSLSTPLDWLCLMQHYELPTRLLDWTESILIALYFAVIYDDPDCDGAIWALNPARINEVSRFSKPKRLICEPHSTDVILRSTLAISRTCEQLKSNLIRYNLFDTIKDAVVDKNVIEWIEKGSNANLSDEDLLKIKNKFSSPIGVFPNRLNYRMSSQLSVVVLHGGKLYDNELFTFIDKKITFNSPKSITELNIESEKKFLKCFIVDRNNKTKIREQLKRVGIHAALLFSELEYHAEFIKKHWRIPLKGNYEELNK